MTVNEINPNEYNPYYNSYLEKLRPDLDLKEGYRLAHISTKQFFQSIPKEKHLYRYADDKWSINEVLQHLIDTERIFSYRAFRIARGDKTPLAEFNQNIYVPTSNADKKGMDVLLEEYIITRNATSLLVNSLSLKDLSRIGISSMYPMSARSALFTILGHDKWHIDIIQKRYL